MDTRGKIQELVLRNDYFKAGVGILVVGGALNLMKNALATFWNRLQHMFVIKLEVNSKDESYLWLLEWLSRQPYTKNATRLSLISSFDEDRTTRVPRVSSYKNFPATHLSFFYFAFFFLFQIFFTPSLGSHMLTYQGSPMTNKKRFCFCLLFCFFSFSQLFTQQERDSSLRETETRMPRT
jgi:hypothetical protein